MARLNFPISGPLPASDLLEPINRIWFVLSDLTQAISVDPATGGQVANITSGLIDGALIGSRTPSSGVFTSLSSSSGALNGTLGATTPAAATVTTLTSTGSNAFARAFDSPVDVRLLASSGLAAGIVGTFTNHPLAFYVNNALQGQFNTNRFESINAVRTPLIDTASGPLTFTPNTDIVRVFQASTTEAQLRAEQSGTGDASFSWFLGGANEIKATAVRSAAQLQFTAANPFNFGAFDYNNGNVSWGGFPGAESLRVVPVASAVNRIEVLGSATGVATRVRAQGSDSAVVLSLAAQGGSTVYLETSNGLGQVAITHTASANRYLTLTGSNGGSPTVGTNAGPLRLASPAHIIFVDDAASGFVSIAATGSTNSTIDLAPAGTGVVRVLTAGGADEQFRVNATAGATRFATVTGSNGGNPSFGSSAGGLTLSSALTFTNQTVGTTVGAIGAASALPALPLGYITLGLNAIGNVRIPYYN